MGTRPEPGAAAPDRGTREHDAASERSRPVKGMGSIGGLMGRSDHGGAGRHARARDRTTAVSGGLATGL